MRFRLFEDSDLDLYLKWVNQREIWEVDNIGPYEVKTRESFLAQWQKIVGWRRSWMVEVEGREIGYVGFVSDDDGGLTDEFFIVIGETTEWGKGHGKAAMCGLFRMANEFGLTKLSGQVLGNNHRALSFYDKLGFRVVEEREPWFERNGKKYATLLIEKALQ